MGIIKHQSFVDLYNKDQTIFDQLFKDTFTLTQLSNNIKKISKNWNLFSYEDEDKLKGDLFEIFAECFFKILSADNRVGIYNYNPESSHNDFGVDGFGIGMDGNPLTVQVKFRSDVTTELTLKDIKNFQGISYKNYKVPVDTNTNLVFFTNAKGLNWVTESKVLSGSARTFGDKQISAIIENNTVFWNNLMDLIRQTIKELYGE